LLNTLNGHTSFVDSVDFSPDGTRIASGGWDNTIRIWNASTGVIQNVLPGHGDIVRGLHFSPDSGKLASGSWDHSIRIWNVATGASLSTWTAPDPGAVNALRYDATGTKIFSGGIGAGGFVHDAASGSVLAHLGHHLGTIRVTSVSGDQSRLVTGAGDFDCRVWDAATGVDLVTFGGHDDVINAIDLTFDGTVAFSGSGSPPPDTLDVSIRIWSTVTGQQLHLLAGHPTGTTGVELTPDEQVVISGGRDGLVKRWSASTGALQASFGSTVGVVTHLQLSPDGTRLAIAGNALRTIDPATGAILHTFAIPGGNAVDALCWSADGQRLLAGVAAYGNNLFLFDAATGGLVRAFSGDPNGFVQGVALSVDGHTAACGSGYSRTIHTFFVDDGSPLKVWDRETGWGPFPLLPLVYLADGRLAYGRADATVVMSGCPGQITAYGSGLAGSSGFVPALSVGGCATAGGALLLIVNQALGGSTAHVVLGTGQGAIPLAGGMLLVDPLVTPVPFVSLPLASGGPGAGTVALPVITPPWFTPQTLTTQAWIPDGGAIQGWSNTNGVSLTFQ
jgi:WD40 repeat protein